jgi:hypothetical protein
MLLSEMTIADRPRPHSVSCFQNVD